MTLGYRDMHRKMRFRNGDATDKQRRAAVLKSGAFIYI
jgi:hypothetical protein